MYWLRLSRWLNASRTTTSKSRITLVDAIRGGAIAGVVLFHLVWDLEYAGFVSGIAFHPIWLAFGRLLAGTFMALVGVSMVLAYNKELRIRHFLRRTGVIATAALIITAVTWFVFPHTFVFFGILHAIAVASLISILLLPLPVWAIAVSGIGFLIMPDLYSSDVFNSRMLAWIGLFTIPPPSNDFVPVFPWVGLTILGMATAKLVMAGDHVRSKLSYGEGFQIVNALVWMGRHSLAIYLIHQPLLLAIIIPFARLSSG